MCPFLTPARNLRRKSFCLVFLRYFSDVFQPILPRELKKGYRVLDQLLDTSTCFPTFSLHCRFLVVSTHWDNPSQRFSTGQSIKWGYFGEPLGFYRWHFIEQGSECGRAPLHSKDLHQRCRKMTQVCRKSCGASFCIHVQPWAVPAAGLSLGAPVRGTTHFTEDQGLRSVTAISRMGHFGPNRAEQGDECLKWIFFSFSPVDQGLQYVAICNFPPSVCVCVCNSFPCS